MGFPALRYAERALSARPRKDFQFVFGMNHAVYRFLGWLTQEQPSFASRYFIFFG